MRKITLLLPICFIGLFIHGCGGSASIGPEEYSYKIYDNKKIVESVATALDGYTSPDYQIVDGEKLVFEYTYKNTEAVNTQGSEVIEIVVFEIGKGASQIFYSNEEITKANCYFKRMCQCKGSGVFKVHMGKIKGYKLSEKEWDIELDVTAMGIDTFVRDRVELSTTASEVFKKQ